MARSIPWNLVKSTDVPVYQWVAKSIKKGNRNTTEVTAEKRRSKWTGNTIGITSGDILLKSSGIGKFLREIQGSEASWIEELLVAEHSPDAMEQFAHDSGQCDHLFLTLSEQMLVVGFDRGC